MNDERASSIPIAQESAEIVDTVPELFGLDDRDDNKTLRWTLTLAAVLHLVLLAYHFPDIRKARTLPAREPGKAFLVQTVRFKPPAPQRKKENPRRKAKKIPIPDPTPDEPEPIEVAELDVPEIDSPLVDDVVFGIPEAPPGPAGGPHGPLQVGGDIRPPEKLYAPQPRYSEEARKARLQGAVILQTVIDALGNVSEVKVLKGLSAGLTESAIETVRQWRFRPATRNGEPVPVYFNLVVTFRVQ